MKNAEARTAPTNGNINLHTLNVWTPLAGVMKNWFWAMNSPTDQYVQGQIWITQETRPYTHDEICDIARTRGQKHIAFRLADGKGNNLILRGAITLLIPVTLNPHGWIMGIDGIIGEIGGDMTVPVKMPVYYDTEYGRGFHLLPEKIGYQICGHGY